MNWKELQYSLNRKLGGIQRLSGGFGQEKSLSSPEIQTPNSPAPVHANPAPQVSLQKLLIALGILEMWFGFLSY
jgi:hypothetical protein